MAQLHDQRVRLAVIQDSVCLEVVDLADNKLERLRRCQDDECRVRVAGPALRGAAIGPRNRQRVSATGRAACGYGQGRPEAGSSTVGAEATCGPSGQTTDGQRDRG